MALPLLLALVLWASPLRSSQTTPNNANPPPSYAAQSKITLPPAVAGQVETFQIVPGANPELALSDWPGQGEAELSEPRDWRTSATGPISALESAPLETAYAAAPVNPTGSAPALPAVHPNADTARSIVPPAAPDLSNVYIGGIHSAHTNYSDGTLRFPEEFYPTFRRHWDWVVTSDHDDNLDAAKWQKTIAASEAANSPDFASFYGFEWTSYVWGHLSVVFRGEQPSPVLGQAKNPAFDEPQKLYTYLQTARGLAVFAHPNLTGLIIDFYREADYRNDSIACLVGLLGRSNTVHWNSVWDYLDGRTAPVPGPHNPYAGSYAKAALDLGYRLGFVAELDLHEREIDPLDYRYTGVVADDLSRKAIFTALQKRHTFAVASPSGLGQKILLRADSDDHLMGDAFRSYRNNIGVTLQGKTDLARFTSVSLFVNGLIVQTQTISENEFVEQFTVPLAEGDNYTFFEVQAISRDGKVSQAFTSPMFVTVNTAG